MVFTHTMKVDTLKFAKYVLLVWFIMVKKFIFVRCHQRLVTLSKIINQFDFCLLSSIFRFILLDVDFICYPTLWYHIIYILIKEHILAIDQLF